MLWVRMVRAAAIALLSVMALLVLLLWWVDFGFLKPQIERQIKTLTGRDFYIEGDLTLRVLPDFILNLEQVRLGNAQWGADTDMLAADKAYVKVNLFSLLTGPIVVERLELENLNLLAQVGADDQVNWAFAGAESAESDSTDTTPAAGFSIPVVIQWAEVDGIKLTYRQPDAQDQVFYLDALSARGQDGNTTVLEGQARYQDYTVALDATLAQHRIDVDLAVGDVGMTSVIEFPADGVDFDVHLESLATLGALLALPDHTLPDENLVVKGSVGVATNGIAVRQVQATLPGVQLSASGTRDNAAGLIELVVEANGDRLNRLRPGLPELPFSLHSEVAIDQTLLDVRSYQVKVGDSDVQGSARIDAGPALQVDAQATAKRINLTPFFPLPEPKPTQDAAVVQEEMGEEMVEEEKADGSPASPYVFQEQPLPLDLLQNLNLQIKADVEQLLLHDSDIKQVRLKASADRGTLQLSNQFDGYLGGHFENEVRIIATDKQAQVSIDTKVRGLRIIALSGANVPEDQIPVTDMNVRLKSSGATPRALASSLNGDVVVTQGEGKVSNELVQRFSGDILAQLFTLVNPFAEQEEFTNWQCSLFALKFDSGYGQIEGFLLQSDQLMVVGGGSIDLNHESLNVEFNTKPRTGVGVSADMFVTPFVKLGGTLAKPSVGLNSKGVLLSGGAAFLTGGMSFLYTGILDRATASADRCGEAKAAINALP
ncbi:MAG: hypothetical protein CSH49_19850 [Alcanivorax sp.]|nr:MAG: hypothetical protein CSH49_19850 [Alcanivorax sp.]